MPTSLVLESVTGCINSKGARAVGSDRHGYVQGNVVTKAGGVPAAGIAGPGAGNPLTGSGAEEGTNKFVPHDEPAK